MLFFNKEVYTTVTPFSMGNISYKTEIVQLFFVVTHIIFPMTFVRFLYFLSGWKQVTYDYFYKYIILFYTFASIEYFNSIKDCQRLCFSTSKNAWAFHSKERIFLLCLLFCTVLSLIYNIGWGRSDSWLKKLHLVAMEVRDLLHGNCLLSMLRWLIYQILQYNNSILCNYIFL